MQKPIEIGWVFLTAYGQCPVWLEATGPADHTGRIPVNVHTVMGRADAERRYSSYVEACRRNRCTPANRSTFVEYMESYLRA